MIFHPNIGRRRTKRRRTDEFEPPSLGTDFELAGGQHVSLCSWFRGAENGKRVRIQPDCLIVRRKLAIGVEQWLADRRRELRLRGRNPFAAIGFAGAGSPGEQRDVAPRGVEGKPAVAACDGNRRSWVDAEALEPPKEYTQPRDIVPSDLSAPAAEVRRVEELVERRMGLARAIVIPQVRKAADSGASKRSGQAFGKLQRGDGIVLCLRQAERRVQAVPCPAQPAEEFHDLRIPSCNVGCNLFED